MKKVKIGQIKKSIQDIVIAKSFEGVPVLVANGSSPSLIKGFMLYESPTSVSLCEWFYPNTQIISGIGLPGYYRFLQLKGANYPNLIKSDFSPEELINVLVVMINEHLPTINAINDLDDLVNLMRQNRQKAYMDWTNMAKYAVWLAQTEQKDEALKVLYEALDEAKKQHPHYPRIVHFRDLLIKGCDTEIKQFIDMLEQETNEMITKAGLFK